MSWVTFPSSPRKRGSRSKSATKLLWVPAFAGMTVILVGWDTDMYVDTSDCRDRNVASNCNARA